MRIRPHFTFALWCVLWVVQWWLLPMYYQRTLELGYYPVQADSIGIPIIGARLMVVTLGPPLGVWIWLSIKRARPEFLYWNVWCAECPVRSWLWTAAFGYLAFTTALSILENLGIGLPLNAFASVCWLYVLASLRAIFVGRTKSRHENIHDSAQSTDGPPLDSSFPAAPSPPSLRADGYTDRDS